MDVEVKRRVLAGKPWSFDRQILVINDFNDLTPPSQMELKYFLIWVQVHDMSLLCMTKVVESKIGESIGELEEMDVGGDGVGWGKFLRI